MKKLVWFILVFVCITFTTPPTIVIAMVLVGNPEWKRLLCTYLIFLGVTAGILAGNAIYGDIEKSFEQKK